jgi:hypothetical protein
MHCTSNNAHVQQHKRKEVSKMHANVAEMNKGFIRLVQLKHSKLHADAASLGEHWTPADEGEVQDGKMIATAEELGRVTLQNVLTVTLQGGGAWRTRWNTGNAGVMVDMQGQGWIDEQLHDEVFC